MQEIVIAERAPGLLTRLGCACKIPRFSGFCRISEQGFGSFRLAWAEILLRMGWHGLSLCLFPVEISVRFISPDISLWWHLYIGSLTVLPW